ncbi:MAG: hypothetical protein RLZZ21_468 [Planctomycetota bacterium]|jgi:hypothetical protein
MPWEPAYATKRSQDGEAQVASERAKNRMFVASVRRRGVGSPELPRRRSTWRGIVGACGILTVGHMRSMWTTGDLHTTRSFDVAIAPPKHTATSPPATRGRSW